MPPSGAYYKKVLPLLFIPPNFVHVSWDGIKAEKPDDERVESFATYINQTWMNGHFISDHTYGTTMHTVVQE